MRALFFVFFLMTAVVYAAPNTPVFMSAEQDFDILFENRLLASVNGKPVTVYDVMKKMDVIFYRQYPEYVSSKQARFQFYQMSWKQILKELVDKELMMADAEESKIEVTASEVRQELEKSFGPNIIANLDKIDMSLDEAKAILQSEILIRKMMTFKVTGKAYRSINPQDLKSAYTTWSKENIVPETWVYRVLTIRSGKDGEQGKGLASLVHKWLEDGKGDLVQAKAAFEKLGILNDQTKISTSEEFSMTKEEMLPEIRVVLEDLGIRGFSEPVAQKSRRDDSVSWKIYALEKVVKPSSLPFKEMETKLREKILDERISKEGKEYMDYLHDHYHVHDAYVGQLPQDWQPFNLIELKSRL